MNSGVQKDFVKVNKITFQNVKDNFGLSEAQNYYNVQGRGYAPLKHFDSSKAIFKKAPEQVEKVG
jgi:ribosomal protein S19E (S16A)